MVNCRDVQNRQNCGALCVVDGWFSKLNFVDVNATQVCIDQGYDGTIDEYGGNRKTQCRYPGKVYGNPSLGGPLESFGNTVSWRCTTGNLYLML